MDYTRPARTRPTGRRTPERRSGDVEEVEDVLTRWRASPAILEGLLTPKEIRGFGVVL